MKDSAIIDLFFDRNDTGIKELEIKYGTKMKSHACRYLSDRRDAEEIYNDTLAAIWNSIPPDHPNRLFAYIMTVLECKIINRLKYMAREKRNRSGEVLFSDFDDIIKFAGASSSAEDVVVDSKNGLINEFLDSESASSRKIFLKRYYYGKSISEIASEAGMTETAVYARISRTKTRLYAYLQRKGIMS